MKFNIIGRKMSVSEKKTDYITKKIGRLDKFFKTEPEARIVIGSQKGKEYIEATIYSDGLIVRAESEQDDIFSAIDKVTDIIERQIRKNKTRLEKKIKREAVSDNELLSGEVFSDEEDGEFKVIKTKRFSLKPMSVQEAILQMNLLGHSFYVFKNQDTDELNVVYKRKDGNFAVIESV